MAELKPRIKRLAKRLDINPPAAVVMFWSDDPQELVTVAGEQMTRAEFDRRWPNARVITWDDDLDLD